MYLSSNPASGEESAFDDDYVSLGRQPPRSRRRRRDGGELEQASLRRIEEKLDTLPKDAPNGKAEQWKLPETPLKVGD